MSVSVHSWCTEMENLITSDCVLVIILSAPAIVHPNYNYYSYDQGRVFVVTIRPRQSGLLLKSYLHQIDTYCSTYNYWHKKYCSSEDECHDLALISIRPKCCENIKKAKVSILMSGSDSQYFIRLSSIAWATCFWAAFTWRPYRSNRK